MSYDEPAARCRSIAPLDGACNICALPPYLDLIVLPWPYVFENDVNAIFKREAKHESLSP